MSETNNTTTATASTSTTTSSETYLGRVKWFNSSRGYGFLTNIRTNDDVFVHHSGVTVNEDCWKTLYPGEYVSYDLETSTGDEKFQAVNVTGVEGGMLLCETRSILSREREEHNRQHGSTQSGDNRRGGYRGQRRGGNRRPRLNRQNTDNVDTDESQ